MDLSTFVNAALGAAGGGGVVGALVLAMYQHNLRQEREQREQERSERAGLAARIRHLETERIAGLEKEFREHVKSDRSQELLVKLESLTGAVHKLTDSTMRALELNARQEAHLVAHDNFLQNLDRVLQDHLRRPHSRR